MKKITLLVAFLLILSSINTIQAQVDESANWPDTNWTVTGSYNLDFPEALKDPTIESNFGWNDDLASFQSLFDDVAAESPEYDITSATTVGELELIVEGTFTYTASGDELVLQWYDNDAHIWLPWHTFVGNSSNYDFVTCAGLINYTSAALNISAFTPSQLQHFKYRFSYIDNGHKFGFCFSSPRLYSRDTPECFTVTDIATVGTILDDKADITWVDNNGITPQDGWEIEYGITGFTQGSGSGMLGTSFAAPFSITGLNASTCYDVYVRALCDNAAGINSEWVGPYNFCTPIAMAGCGDVFYDTGGPNGDYENSYDETTTICPDNTGDVVTVIFDSFALEVGGPGPYDWLKIYDGDSASSPQIIGPDANNTFSGNSSPGMITATIANGGCLTFVFHSDSVGVRPGWEARILCSPPITCFMPEDLAVNDASITIHEAEISWTDTNTTPPTSGWDIEYGPIGFTQGAGTPVNATTNPFTLTNLDPATEYCYYVKAACGVNSGDEDSFWQGPVCFTTLCDVFIAPYSENFNNDGDTPNCWEQGVSNSENWLFDNDVTNPGHIGFAGNVSGTTTLSGGYFAYVDDDAPNSLNTALVSPFVDLTGIANPTLGFYFISHHEFLFQSVKFSIDIWDGATWNEEVFTHTGNTNPNGGWEQQFVDLSAYAGQVIQVRFMVDENSSSIFDDFAIDDVFIGEMPACVNVNSIVLDNVGSVDAMFTWQDGNNPVATDWDVVYGAPGFDPNSETPIPTTNNTSYVLGGLTPQTDYEVYIRANCGNGEFSLWAGPIAFTTLCAIFDAPYHEDFEDAGLIDDCWSQSNGIDNWFFANVLGSFAAGTAHVGDNGDVFGTVTESGGYFAFIDDSDPSGINNSITTPLINTTPLTSPALYFYYVSDNEGSSNVDFSIDVWDGAAWNTDFFTSNTNTFGWELKVLDLTNLTITGPIKIKFTVDENNGTRDDFAIDDVKVDEKPDCWQIYDPIVSNETTTTVDITWTDNDNDPSPGTTYYIEYGPVGFTPGASTFPTQDVNPFANPYTVTGLDVDTDWDFYVYAVCPNGTSMVGPVQGTTLPTCLEVTGVLSSNATTTSVDVSWTDNNTPIPAGNWDLEVTFPSFGQGTGTVYANVTSPFTIPGLIPSSTFEIYIRANCEADGSDPSRWTGPFTINTQVGPPLNDFCVDAIELTPNSECIPVLGNNIQATQTTPALATNCTDPAVSGTDTNFIVDDVWYKFTYPATSGSVTIKTSFAGVMEDSVMAVYRATDLGNECGTLEPAFNYLPNGDVNYALATCSDDDDFDLTISNDDNKFSLIILRNQNPGDVFYIRVWSADRTNIPTDGKNEHGQFTICLMGNPTLNRLNLLGEDDQNINAFTLDYYPNPTNDDLIIKANKAIKAVRVFSILGQEVSNQTFDTINIEQKADMTSLQAGTYFVKVYLENETSKTIKVIKK